jgi:hypothetical protein
MMDRTRNDAFETELEQLIRRHLGPPQRQEDDYVAIFNALAIALRTLIHEAYQGKRMMH